MYPFHPVKFKPTERTGTQSQGDQHSLPIANRRGVRGRGEVLKAGLHQGNEKKKASHRQGENIGKTELMRNCIQNMPRSCMTAQ